MTSRPTSLRRKRRPLRLVVAIAVAVGVVSPGISASAQTTRKDRKPTTTVAPVTIVGAPDEGVVEPDPTDCGVTLGPWDPVASGRPTTLRPLGPAGLYVWNRGNQWYVMVTHPDRKRVEVRGTITFDRPINAAAVRLDSAERQNDVVTRPDRSRINFTFTNFGGLDGLQFNAGCAGSITITARAAGQPFTAQQVFVGQAAVNVATVPFTFSRRA
jgi:hypothetical protein